MRELRTPRSRRAPRSQRAPRSADTRLRETSEGNALLTAETHFALARALWATNPDSDRARRLAGSARSAYADGGDKKQAAEIAAWLASR